MLDAEASVRSVIEGWAVWRDAGAWKELRSTWTADGRMNTTWFRGSADDFVEAAREAFEAGALVHHFLGGSVIDIVGGRATAQTKTTIAQRLMLGDTEVDVTCVGRFFDFFEQHDDAWQIVLREPIYEKDRIDPVVPGEVPPVDQAVLASFPAGCRHLLYCQVASGLQVNTDPLSLRGDAVERLYLDGRDWLAGGGLTR